MPSSRINSVFKIAGTARTGHTMLRLIHVGSFGTAAAVHRGERGLARDVGLAEGAAGTTAAGHVVAIHHARWTFTEAAWWER